ncbi:MAG TPA: hypothetical protein VF421_11090 [Niabella sp.]
MEHFFELPITHRGAQLTFKGRLVTFAYNYKFFIIAESQELVFEKDDEGEFRVLSDHKQTEIDQELLSTIVHALENISSLDKTG